MIYKLFPRLRAFKLLLSFSLLQGILFFSPSIQAQDFPLYYVTFDTGTSSTLEKTDSAGNNTVLVPSGGGLNNAYGVVFGPDGNLYISNYAGNAPGVGFVNKFTPAGNLVGTFL